MKETNLELLAAFEQCLKGLNLWSETESPYEVLIWEASERGEFSVEALLLSLSYLTPVDHQNLFADVEERLSGIEQDVDIVFNRENTFIYSLEQYRSIESSFDKQQFIFNDLESEIFRATILERLRVIR